MTEKDKKLLDELSIRIKQLMYLCDSLKEENIALKQQIQQKNTEVDTLNLEVEQLKSQYDNLLFAKSFSEEEKNDMLAAKERLSKLVQDVEKCIVLLKG
jgi:regulator of replication initiation timing